ncbi:HK97 family phage prohead protease [Sandarakinorhabdus sp.]|uniref:phage major capsid protein n=1 Tax=Sandarakinorhabdus sp. TaxID=1916663 RepID=UPI00286E89F5|nr:HK97 family phage prohead protease [Sandarakinorhabdus sp.]
MTNAPRSFTPPTGCMATRAASTVPASYNEADGSFEVIWTTGAAVRRYDWAEGEFDEILSTDPQAVRLDRLNAGAPVLRVHDRHTLEGVVGSVVPGSARMANGQGVARIRLADTPDAADVVAKVLAGHVRNVSVGYMVHQYEPVATADGERKQMRAIDWEPHEISLVPIPADPATHIRSLDDSPASAGRSLSLATIRRRAADCGLSDTVAADLMERHAATPFSNESLTAMLSRHFVAKDQAPRVSGRGASVLNDPNETLRARIGDALLARMSGKAPPAHAREFMGAGLVGMARAMLEASGENVRWKSDAEILERAMHTTSDFKGLLTASGNRFLLDTFALAESAIKRVARQRTAPDFRALTALKLGGAPTLDLVGESGEVRRGTMFEGSETYRLGTFSKIFGISRQAIINDDLGAFADPLRVMARGAAETEAQQLAALINANSGAGVTLSDTNPLYHTSRGNVAAAGGAISVTSLGAARQAGRDQKDLDGTSPLNVEFSTLLVPSALETLAETMLANLTPNTPAGVNPFSGRLELAVDPRLTGTSWRLFADPAAWPVLEYAYLDGAVGPQLSSRDGWDVLGMEYKVVLDFGCGAVDHRGTYRNPGV